MAAEYNPDVEVDMTPMIDVTFLLIIFFMLITKMTQDELEPVELPAAEKAEEDKSEDQKRLIINLAKGPSSGGKASYRVVVNGTDVTPARSGGKWQATGSPFEKVLIREADLKGKAFSERQVLIRADKDCPYEYVAMVMGVLTKPNVKIFKIQLGAKKVEAGQGER